MTTIQELSEKGILTSIVVELAESEQPNRLIYGTQGFLRWLEGMMNSDEPSSIGAELSLREQLDLLIYTFVTGRPLVYSRQFRFIRSEESAVWELKTADLRIFGWFMKKDCFAAVFGDRADRVKDHDLYRGYRLEIRRFRREFGLNDTLCVKGVEPGDVLSL